MDDKYEKRSQFRNSPKEEITLFGESKSGGFSDLGILISIQEHLAIIVISPPRQVQSRDRVETQTACLSYTSLFSEKN